MAAQIFHGSTPELFERWLRRATSISLQRNARAPLVFVNSWNEWAEGAHLEPDERTGLQYLEALRRVVLAEVGEVPDWIGHDAPDGLAQSSGDVPIATLAPGMPDLDDMAVSTTGPGNACIDSVDGELLSGHVVSADKDGSVRMSGWFFGDARSSGRREATGHLLVSSEGHSWHVTIQTRHRRADLQRAMLARDRTTRRMVRLIDRLPPASGSASFGSGLGAMTTSGSTSKCAWVPYPPGSTRSASLTPRHPART